MKAEKRAELIGRVIGELAVWSIGLPLAIAAEGIKTARRFKKAAREWLPWFVKRHIVADNPRERADEARLRAERLRRQNAGNGATIHRLR